MIQQTSSIKPASWRKHFTEIDKKLGRRRTDKEVAERTGFCRQTIRSMRKRLKIKPIPVGGTIMAKHGKSDAMQIITYSKENEVSIGVSARVLGYSRSPAYALVKHFYPKQHARLVRSS